MSDDPTEKRRGRPRTFEMEAALDAAVEVFWAKGHDGASLDDLTGAMGIGRPSLYAAFGDKRALFLAAMDRYAGGIGSAAMAAFEAEPEIARAVERFLDVSLQGNTEPGRPAGCLLACCAGTSAGTVEGVASRLAAVFAGTEARLTGHFEAEVAGGRLAAIPSPQLRAARLVDMMTAQAVRARAGESRETLRAGLPGRVAAVMSEDALGILPSSERGR